MKIKNYKFPDLSKYEIISIDIETKDPYIKTHGTGARHQKDKTNPSYILGVSIAVSQEKKWYFPFRHPKSDNISMKEFFIWIKQYKDDKIFLGANITYDYDFMQYHSPLPKNIYDVQFAEPLLNENKKKYNLDSLCVDYLNLHKEDEEMKAICEANGWKGAPQEHMWKMTTKQVEKYVLADTAYPLLIFEKQLQKLKEENLFELFKLECSLIPLLLEMRKTGVRIDVIKLKKLKKEYENDINKNQSKLNKICDMEVNTNAGKNLQEVFDKFNYQYFYTEKGNVCFDASFLESCDHEIAKLILEIRHLNKVYNTYIVGIENLLIKDRIHCHFNPLRSDKYGTVSGRFSCSLPNLQNIPERNPKYKKDIRGLFLPEENCDWIKLDVNQEEMAIFAHYARGTGAEELRKMYTEDEKADLYVIMAKLGTGKKEIDKVTRKKWKQTTLGVLYGMGTEKLGRSLGIIMEPLPSEISVSKDFYIVLNKIKDPSRITKETFTAYYWQIYWYNKYNDREDFAYIPKKYHAFMKQYIKAHDILKKMHDRLPCLKTTTKECQDVCIKRGYVKTILGRKRRLTPNEAYKAFNAVDQGSAGDIMKKIMVEAYKKGIFKILPLHLTVHDELDVSKPGTKKGEKALKELKYIMENAVKLRVPLRVEVETGESWGTVK